MSKSQKNYSPNSVPMFRPPHWKYANSLRDRLDAIYGRPNPRMVLRLVQQARNFQELIRRKRAYFRRE